MGDPWKILAVLSAMVERRGRTFTSLPVGELRVWRSSGGVRQAGLALLSPKDISDIIEGRAAVLHRGPLVQSRRKLSWLGALFVLMAMGCLVRGRPRWGLLRFVGIFQNRWNAKVGA